jgi:hypothetical protein
MFYTRFTFHNENTFILCELAEISIFVVLLAKGSKNCS